MAESDSGRYNFDAPSYVVDFAEQRNDESEDKWFEKQTADGHLKTPLRPEQRSHEHGLPRAVVTPPIKTDEHSGPCTSPTPPPNLVTSWGSPARTGARPKQSVAHQPPAQPRRVSKRKEMTSGPPPPSKKRKKTPPVVRKSSVVQKSSVVLRNKEQRNTRSVPKTQPAASTAANTDSEEQELERIRTQKEVALHRKQNKASHKAALAGRPTAVKGDKLKVTQPHTPHLMTRQRSRPTTLKSSAELEAEEVEKLHKFKFNALALNRKILERAECLKRPAVKEPTVPEGFELQIEKRLHERQSTKNPQDGDEKPPNFKARRLPKKILEGVVGLPEKRVLLLTVPESPAFALKNRVRMEKVEKVKQPSPVKAQPVPHFGLPFQPQLQENHHVEVCPFSFEERDRERRALKEKRLEEMRNGEVPQFKAQPLPDFDAVVLPEKKKLEPTKPEPFRLLLDERGTVRSSRWEQMVKEEQKQEEAAVFKARPNTVSHKEPFQPKKEVRPNVVVEAFKLSTERRALEWQEHERHASEKEALRRLMEEQHRQEQEQKEKEEIARLRQEQVHVAQPIRHYKHVAVKKSEVPLTVPQSPNFSQRFHL